jgi:sporulation protein YlmC with PRC-barrel domain
MSVTFDLARDLLDNQIVDSQGCPCGKVDDIELERHGRTFRIGYLLSGPGAAARRLPASLGAVYRWVAGVHTSRIPWSEVESVGPMIHLRKTAAELALHRAELPAQHVIERLPRS